jgi:hypothetical protein
MFDHSDSAAQETLPEANRLAAVSSRRNDYSPTEDFSEKNYSLPNFDAAFAIELGLGNFQSGSYILFFLRKLFVTHGVRGNAVTFIK